MHIAGICHKLLLNRNFVGEVMRKKQMRQKMADYYRIGYTKVILIKITQNNCGHLIKGKDFNNLFIHFSH